MEIRWDQNFLLSLKCLIYIYSLRLVFMVQYTFDISESDPTCRNEHNDRECKIWANYGHCAINPSYMSKMCKKSCNKCESGAREDTNEDPRDPYVDLDKEQKDGSFDVDKTTKATLRTTTDNTPKQGLITRVCLFTVIYCPSQ